MNILSIIQKQKVHFYNYCESLPIAEELKFEVLNFFKERPSDDGVYLIYPLFFIDETQNQEVLNNVCFASYFIYSHINLNDSLYDNVTIEKKEKNQIIFLSGLFLEEGIKLLSHLFKITDPFWKIWNQRKKEFFTALLLDRKFNSESFIEWKDYEMLADYRSSFGKIAVDIWYCLFPKIINNQKRELLIKSQKYFTVGFQIIDDISDIKKDFTNNQINIAISETKRFLKKQKTKPKSFNEKELIEIFYRENISITLYQKALLYLKKSKEILSIYNEEFKHWKQFVDIKIKETTLNIANIEYQFKKWETQTTFSNTFRKENTLSKAILNATHFIKSNQNENGSWSDFVNNAGMSNVWTTGYILTKLPLQKTHDSYILKACEFLKKNKQRKLWGYNTHWINDTDSTTCVLFALSKYGYNISKEFQLWKKKQLPSGGFSTYNDEFQLYQSLNFSVNDVKGWLMEHTCVSALAYNFLNTYKIESETTKKLKKYIDEKKDIVTLWDSYWWTSPVYSISYILETIIENNKANKSEILKISSKLIQFIDNKSFTVIDETSKENIFFTAMIISAICSSKDTYVNNKYIIDMSVKNVLNNQYEDGSFPTSYALRIPTPNTKNPKEIKKWNVDHRGTNIITNDFKRLFTTVSCLNALSKYNLIQSDD